MTETRTTATLSGIAVALTVLAWATAPRRPVPEAFADRGSIFFPGFRDPTLAQSLEVTDFDEETATARVFKVQVKNGLWTIPSRYDYPADGQQRLSTIAAAIIGLTRDNVASENVADHERTGTLDPFDETLPTLQGRGTRVTFKSDNDRTLADIIIGNPLDGRPAFRYVRLPNQARVYVAKTGDVTFSTTFRDWIDPDLLKIEWPDVDEMIVRDYSLNRATRAVNVRDTLILQKLGEDDNGRVLWTQRGGRPGERVDTFTANLVNTAADQLEILGVRPKPPGIAAGMAQTSGILRVSQDERNDLGSRGFYFTPAGELVADQGELLVHTKTGVFYRLWFGDVASGDEGETGAGTAAGSRYLIATAQFDPMSIPAGPERDAARARAAQVQARFAPWYYVVSGESVERMRPSRRAFFRPAGIEKARPR